MVIALLATLAALGAAPSLEDLVQAVDLSSVSIAPDGASVVFRTETASPSDNRMNLTWRLARLDDGAVRRLGDGGGALWSSAGVLKSETPQWTPDGAAVLLRELGADGVQVHRLQVGGNRDDTVTHDAGDVLTFRQTPDGHFLDYTAGAPRTAIVAAEIREADSGILVDKQVDMAQALIGGAEINGRRASERLTGRWFARQGLLADAPPSHDRVDLISLRTVGAAPASDRSKGPSRLNAAGDSVILSTRGLAVQRPTGRLIRCEEPFCRGGHLVAAIWRPGHDELLLTRADTAHRQQLAVWRVGGPARLLVTSDGLLNGGREAHAPCAVSEAVAVCVAASPASPPRLERIDLDTGRRTVLYDPNQRLRQAPVDAEPLEWTAQGGTRFTGVLFHVPGRKRGPLFINYYRCEGYLRGGLGDEWPFAALASAGIAALCIDQPPARGAGYNALDAYRTAALGVGAAIDLLARRGLVDRTRVGMGGLSFGSEVTTWVAMRTDLLAAVSIASLQLEPAYFWFNGVAGRDTQAILKTAWGLGAPDKTPERWKLLSPALNVSRLRAPILLQLPEQEARLSMELYARLTASPTPAELYGFPDEPHIKIQPRHRASVYARNLDWFRFWLRGEEDPDPAKAAQYARWRALAARRDALMPSSGATAPRSPGRRSDNRDRRAAPPLKPDRILPRIGR